MQNSLALADQLVMTWSQWKDNPSQIGAKSNLVSTRCLVPIKGLAD